MHIQETEGNFGFHLVDDKEDPHLIGPVVQLYVKSSALSSKADLAISPRLSSEADVDRFVEEAIAALRIIRDDAKKALAQARTD